jgi:hypothetical protein
VRVRIEPADHFLFSYWSEYKNIKRTKSLVAQERIRAERFESALSKCLRCDGARWVCEATHAPWGDGARACPCGAVGNNFEEGAIPEMPEGFVTRAKLDW